MRLLRTLPRKVWRLLMYLAIGGLVVFLFPLLKDLTQPQRDAPVDAKVKRSVEELEVQKESNAEWPYGKDKTKKDWHDYESIKLEAARSGPGEQGSAVKVPQDAETKAKQDQMYRVNGYDAYVSDQIPLNRSVQDIRHKGCKAKQYLNRLPTVSVILPFHNEHWTVLLRSCHSILIRSPKELIKEIIIVDDASTKEFLKSQLDEYIKDNLPQVKVVRTKKREGLIRARQIGAQQATGEVIIFLDAHSEPNINWLPPLLEPIAEDYRTVVCPFVDVIDCDTFEYRAQDDGARGSFDWEFNYKRLPLLARDKLNPTEPFESPVMAGGYFAISTKWFWELGGYDEGLDIWGGEQYELSFKVWQCHGRMVDAPCSRVGHIYRCKHVPFPNPGVGDFISRNYRRVAEVWMDEYAEHLYKRRPSLKTVDPLDLTKQKAVRERLKCKSFKWFMTAVMPDQAKYYPFVEPPDGAKGKIKSVGLSGFCIDAQHKDKNEPFVLNECGRGEQEFRLTWFRDIRPTGRSSCFDASTSVRKAPVVLFPCHGMMGNQNFRYNPDKKQLFHPISGQCVDSDASTHQVFMNPCDPQSPSQQWDFENVDRAVLDDWAKNVRTID